MQKLRNENQICKKNIANSILIETNKIVELNWARSRMKAEKNSLLLLELKQEVDVDSSDCAVVLLA